MTDLRKIIADWRENGTPGPWAFSKEDFNIGSKFSLFQKTEKGKGRYFVLEDWLLPDPADAALIAAAPDMAERFEALEAEVARLQALLEAQDAYMAGEPSRPPSSGKSPAALDGETADD